MDKPRLRIWTSQGQLDYELNAFPERPQQVFLVLQLSDGARFNDELRIQVEVSMDNERLSIR